MSKKIQFKHDGKVYTLEYNRASVKWMESQGFSIAEVDTKPETMISILFQGAFFMHHRNVASNPKILDDIFDNITQKESLITTLAEMYQEPLMALLGEPEESEGNIKWETI